MAAEMPEEGANRMGALKAYKREARPKIRSPSRKG